MRQARGVRLSVDYVLRWNPLYRLLRHLQVLSTPTGAPVLGRLDNGCWLSAGKGGISGQPPLAADDRGELLPQPLPRAGLVQAGQVDVDHRPQQPRRFAWFHPH